MKCLVLIIIALFGFAIKSNAQNHVPNFSFENFSTCPGGNQFYNLPPWCGLAGGEDSYNTCFNVNGPGGTGVPYAFQGFQYPRTGNGFGSMVIRIVATGTINAERREYIHVPLLSNLQNGKTYCGTMFLNLLNTDKYTSDRIGMALTSNSFACNQAFPSPQTIAPLAIIPQVANTLGNFITDTLNWIEVSGTFTANGTEAYLTIGNFYDDANTATSIVNASANYFVIYFHIDDVSVEEVFPAKAKNDTLIYQGDSTIIGNNTSEAALFSWQPTTGLSCTNCPNPKASPSVTTTYTVTKTQCKAVTSDVITVAVSPVGVDELVNVNSIKISPNPAKDVLNIDISTSLDITKELSVKITDVLGREILLSEFKEQLDISQLETGIYFVSILQGNKTLVTKKVIKE